MAFAHTGFDAGALGFPTGVLEMQKRGRAFWGPDIDDGDRVNIQKAQAAAQDRYMTILEQNPGIDPVMPIVDLVDPDWVRKAVYTEGYSGIDELKTNVQKALDDFASSVDEIRKATTTSSNLMHTIVDTDVTMLFKRICPAQTLIPTEANKGKVASWDAIPPNGAGSAFFGSEDPVLVESDMSSEVRTDTCKIMYSVMRLTKMAIEAGKKQVPARDLMSIRSMAATEMIKQLRERSILGVTRDVTVAATAYAAATSLQYKGLYELITANTTTANYEDVSGSTINTMDLIQPYLDNTYTNMIQDGLMPNLALTDYKTFGIYRRGLNDFFRTESTEHINFGVAKIDLVFPAGSVPMVPVPFLPSTAGTNGAIFLLDTQFLARRVLWADTYEDLANLNTSKRGVITASEVVIDKTDVDGSSSLQGGVFGITIA